MGDGQAVTIIRSAVAAFNRGDMDAYLEHFDPSALRWVDGFEQPLTVSDIRDSLEQLRTGFDELRLQEDLLFGTERFVCARWRLCGTQVGEFMGQAPGQQGIEVPSCEVYEMKGDAVISTWTYGDPGQLFRQIGDPLESRSPQ
jgi:predicted ester cyclase